MEEQTLMWMKLGNAGVSFDAAKVAVAARTRAGRARLHAALLSALRAAVRPRTVRLPKTARTSTRRLAGSQRAAGPARAAVGRRPRPAAAAV